MLDGIASGGLSLLGGLVQNHAARSESSRNRSFQERMSNTSHQREVADLRAAGLNPILSASKGASTPSGSMATMQNSAKDAVNSYNSAKLIKEQIKNIQADTNLKNTTTYKTNQEAAKIFTEIWNLDQARKNMQNTSISQKQDIDLTQHEVELQNMLGTKSSNFKMVFDILKSLQSNPRRK